ncbi:hypothetical protein [Sulfurimonas autotrophica]|uniref:hypothetical protein n=1 Tax=Sulfurimonas autotrophica TaxID=202747 RepID=UPI00030ABFC4|nr:hypothetical protein [Sulfurimonas autotrophica]
MFFILIDDEKEEKQKNDNRKMMLYKYQNINGILSKIKSECGKSYRPKYYSESI